MDNAWARWRGFEGQSFSVFLEYLDGQFRSRQDQVTEEQVEAAITLEHVLPDRWDLPGRTYIFSSRLDPATRTLQVQLTNNGDRYYAVLGGAAWADVGTFSSAHLVRFWCHTPFQRRSPRYLRLGQLPFRSPSFEFVNERISQRVLDAMTGVLRQVATWRFDAERSSWVGENIVSEEPIPLASDGSANREG